MLEVHPQKVSDDPRRFVHEVNQPLAAILTNAQAALRWLMKDPANLEEATKAIERIIANNNRASELVKSVGNVALSTECGLDINGTIRNIINLNNLAFAQHAITVETKLIEPPSLIAADCCQLQSVIANLVKNGIQTMSTVKDRQRTLTISTDLQGQGDILVAVADTGEGIDPKHADRIFERNFSTKLDGMGLGLTICRSIVEAHGGWLRAAPNRPYGSVFTFAIPTNCQDT